MSDPTSSYQFFSWFRAGAAAAIPAGAPLTARASLTVDLDVNGAPAASVSVDVFGPGDVRGFARERVLRTVPQSGAGAFEPNLFPAVEFDRPDLPWLMTPVRADGRDRLAPWIVLAVVQQQPGVSLALQQPPDGKGGVLVLSIDAPASPSAELPRLADAWAWAHAQAVAAVGENVALGELLAHNQARVRSRLVCSRPLVPGARYHACVVPAFDAGVAAGLGRPLGDPRAALGPAWRDGDAAVRLPVYYTWEFATSATGDFKSLALQLTGRTLDPGSIGTRSTDLSRAGFGLPAATAEVPGVLRPLGAPASAWRDPQRPAFQAALRGVLNRADPTVLAPPTYGRAHAGVTQLDDGSPAWLADLNLDPRMRSFAGAGARVVEKRQESLLAEAWRQLGDAQRAQRVLHLAQLTRGALRTVVKKRLEPMRSDELLYLTAPLHPRTPITDGDKTVTLSHALAHAPVTQPVRPVLRRATRGRGVVLRRQTAPPPAQRFAMKAVTLPDGRLFMFGGQAADPQHPPPANLSAWTYDPTADRWEIQLACPLNPQYNPRPALLPGGRVLALANIHGNQPQASIWTDGAGWNAAAAPPRMGTFARLISLSDGRVLDTSSSAMIYDQAANQWTSNGDLLTHPSTGRGGAGLALLRTGEVLIVGGGRKTDPRAVRLTPSSGACVATQPMVVPRSVVDERAVSLYDGRVLVVGGSDLNFKSTLTCELYDPLTDAWSPAPPLPADIAGRPAVLEDGSVLVVLRRDPRTLIYVPRLDRWVPGPSVSVKRGPSATVMPVRGGRVLVGFDDWPTVDLLPTRRPASIVAQPVSITDYLTDDAKKRIRADLGNARATGAVNGALGWPTPALVNALPASSDHDLMTARQALADQLAGSDATAAPTLTDGWGDSGPSPEHLDALHRALDVDRTIPAHAATRVLRTASSGPAVDPLGAIVGDPDFAQPMFADLRDEDPDFILPGLRSVPTHTLALLEVNSAPIEAYLAGLNTALGRMLAWRGYPTDQRGTAFRQFWDVAAALAPDDRDAPPLTAWGASALGTHLRSRGGFVLLVRSPLLQRYPDTRVTAVAAVWTPDGKRTLTTTERTPLHRASIDPDIAFFGFDLQPAEAIGSRAPGDARPGWFFVFAQHPTAPEFGVDVGAPLAAPATTAAETARATVRRPLRVAIHADTLATVRP